MKIQEVCKKCHNAITKIMYSTKGGWLCSKCNDIEIEEEIQYEKSLRNKKNS